MQHIFWQPLLCEWSQKYLSFSSRVLDSLSNLLNRFNKHIKFNLFKPHLDLFLLIDSLNLSMKQRLQWQLKSSNSTKFLLFFTTQLGTVGVGRMGGWGEVQWEEKLKPEEPGLRKGKNQNSSRNLGWGTNGNPSMVAISVYMNFNHFQSR